MQEEVKHDHCNGACCGMHHGGHKYMILRWVLGLIILGIVFCLGVKVGEFKGGFQGEFYGSGRHMRYGGMMQNNNQYYPTGRAMYYQTNSVVPQQVIPATPAAPAIQK